MMSIRFFIACVALIVVSQAVSASHHDGALEPMQQHHESSSDMEWASFVDTHAEAKAVDFSDFDHDRVFVEAEIPSAPKKAKAKSAPKAAAATKARKPAAGARKEKKSVADRLSPAEQQAKWNEFKARTKKVYKTPGEEQAAFEQFKKNRESIVANNDSHQFGKLNQKPFKSTGVFGDLSPEQFKARFAKIRKPSPEKIKKANQKGKVRNQQQAEEAKRTMKKRNGVRGVASLIKKFSAKKGTKTAAAGAKRAGGAFKAAGKSAKRSVRGFTELSSEIESGADMDLDSLAETAAETETEAHHVLEAEAELDLSTEHEVELEHWLDQEAEADAEAEIASHHEWDLFGKKKSVPTSKAAGSAGSSAGSAGSSAGSAGSSAGSAGSSAGSAGSSAGSAGSSAGSAGSAAGSAGSAAGSAGSAAGSAGSAAGKLLDKPICIDRDDAKSFLEIGQEQEMEEISVAYLDDTLFLEAEERMAAEEGQNPFKRSVPTSRAAGSAGSSAGSAGSSAGSAGSSAGSAGSSAGSAGSSAGSAGSAAGSAGSAAGSAGSAAGSAGSAAGSAGSAAGRKLPFCDELVIQPMDTSSATKFVPFTGSVISNPNDKTANQRLCRVVAHTWLALHAATPGARLIQFGLSFFRGGGIERILNNPMLLCETDWSKFFKTIHPLQAHLRFAYEELKAHNSSHAVDGNPLLNPIVAAEPARSQLNCGSCWAQAAVGSFEVALKKANPGRPLSPLSVQQVLDCVRTPLSNGCSGGVPQDAMEYFKTYPAATERDYPYTGVQGKCRQNEIRSGPKSDGWSFAECEQAGMASKLTFGLIKPSYYVACESQTNCPDQFKYESPLLIAVKTDGPFIAYVDASQWQHYSSGIYPPDKCSPTMPAGNHVVQLVGYGNENGTPFWVVKNSWGENWGEKGFIRLPMGVNACGIANFVGQATVAGAKKL